MTEEEEEKSVGSGEGSSSAVQYREKKMNQGQVFFSSFLSSISN